MVARKGRWHIKWRNHCATCGVVFKRAQRWAYCSKKCEAGRRGLAPDDEPEEAEEYLRLAVELESAPDADRERIAARMAALRRPEVAPVREATIEREQSRVVTMQPTVPKFWLPALRKEWDLFTARKRTLVAAIRFGRHLNEARAALPHGRFGRLFADHRDPAPGALAFASSWARKLMAIAANTTLANRSHGNDLPRDLGTLYQLSLVPAEALELAIGRGDVRRTMGDAEARRLAAGSGAATPVDTQGEG